MKLILILFSLCIFRIDALSLSSRIANGGVAKNAPHVCMVLVIRPGMTDTAALGSGSIVSVRHVLTAAHVVRGPRSLYRINFVVGTSRRSFETNFALIHEDYDPENNFNDIALIFILGDGNMFPASSVITISTEVLTTGAECTVAGYGFTSAETVGFASVDAHSVTQRIATNCQFDEFEVSPSHFCGIDEFTNPGGIVCRGDNGAGLYTTTVVDGNEVNSLVGVASHIVNGCSSIALTGYTRMSLLADWVNNIVGV